MTKEFSVVRVLLDTFLPILNNSESNIMISTGSLKEEADFLLLPVKNNSAHSLDDQKYELVGSIVSLKQKDERSSVQLLAKVNDSYYIIARAMRKLISKEDFFSLPEDHGLVMMYRYIGKASVQSKVIFKSPDVQDQSKLFLSTRTQNDPQIMVVDSTPLDFSMEHSQPNPQTALNKEMEQLPYKTKRVIKGESCSAKRFKAVDKSPTLVLRSDANIIQDEIACSSKLIKKSPIDDLKLSKEEGNTVPYMSLIDELSGLPKCGLSFSTADVLNKYGVTCFGIPVGLSLNRLLPPQHGNHRSQQLNDNVIDACARSIAKIAKENINDINYIDTTTINSLAKTVSSRGVIPLHYLDKVVHCKMFLSLITVFVFNLNNNHWILVIIIPSTKKLVILDSMKSSKANLFPLFRFMQKIAILETGLDLSSYNVHNPRDINKLQPFDNFVDCGVFSLTFFYSLCRKVDMRNLVWDQDFLNRFRFFSINLLCSFDNTQQEDKVQKKESHQFLRRKN